MRSFLVSVAVLISAESLRADWPQFLGPKRDSTTKETVAPWIGSPKVLWKKPVGHAHASPVIADGLVYAFYQPDGENADALAAYDAKTGELKWGKGYEREAYTPPFGKGPRGTPAVADGKVFTLGSTGILAAWDAKTGKVLWKVETLKQFQTKNLFFGVSTSPTVVGDTVVVMVGGKGRGIVGFDVANGNVKWKATDDAASYSTPLVYGEGDRQKLVFLTGANLVGLDAKGEKEWSLGFKDLLNESSTAPVLADGLLIGSSVTAGSVALKLVEKDGKIAPEKVWSKPKLTCYFSTPVAVGKYLFMINGAATLTNPTVTLRCVEIATGEVKWEKEKVGRYHAALIRTGDDRLLMLDDNGYLSLFEPSDKEYKELARSKVCGVTWAHPAIVNGVVYLRDEKNLIALELPAK
ncbi:MAG: PQQ-like beta-propeller repeat protein [Gemmataceae bacterium]|nr:PQQ-like beta-propeller repeat protein [Gemmataceae bacterium]